MEDCYEFLILPDQWYQSWKRLCDHCTGIYHGIRYRKDVKLCTWGCYHDRLLCGISCHERSGMAATCGSCSVCYCMYGSWYRHRKNCLQTTQTCYPACRIDYSDRCQLLFTECRTVIIRCRHKVLYKCCNTAVLKTCRWKSYNLRNHDRDGSCLCHHHGWSDDFYQKNKSRTGDACCF